MMSSRWWGGLFVLGAFVSGCDDGPAAGMESIPDPVPIHVISYSDSVQVSAEAEIGSGGRGDVRVSLVFENPTASQRSITYGPCFFIVRIYANGEPHGPAMWDHRPPRGGGCFDDEATFTIPAGESRTLHLIPDLVPGFNQALPAGRHAPWVLLNRDGLVTSVLATEIEVP